VSRGPGPAVSRDPGAVVHVTPHYPPFLGGLERVVEALAAQRAARGLPVTVLTSRAGLPPGRARAGRRRPARPAAPSQPDGPGTPMTWPNGPCLAVTPPDVRRLACWRVAHTTVIPALPGALLRLPRPSVIHLHVSQAFLPEAVLAAHLLRGLPYLAHLHLEAGPSGPAGFLLRGYQPLVLAPVLRRAGRVVVFTEEQRAAVTARYRLDPARVAVVPNGVDPAFFAAAAGPAGKERPPGARPRLLFAGRLSVQKNIPLLLHALAGVSGRFDTVIAGDGELGPALRATAARLGLRNVRFCGRADGAALRDLYRAADVLVLPSEREGMPLVVLEAMAMGLPVVGTDIPGIRGLVTGGRNGWLVPPGDAAALRAALLQVTADPAGYQRMAAAARQRAGEYTWERAGAEFEPLYAALAQPPHRAGRAGPAGR
jgi:glycosyltransferase involved in cell wall biosynthesis